MIRKALPDLGIIVLLFLLPLLLFAPVALGPRTLLPADALFTFEPYRAAAADVGVAFPHNHLVADLILQNYSWKHFIVEAIHEQELPLWDPYIFAGHPFLANGQHSALYPLSLVFYILPLWRAYGVFAWLQLGLAGAFAYLCARVLGIRRLGALVTGITFQFSGFMIVSSSPHPMIVAGASWLPFVLAMVELVLQQRPALGRRPATLPWALLGALGLGCQMLAGHVENTYFTLLVVGAYVLWRIIVRPVARLPDKSRFVSWLIGCRRPVSWIALMLTLGLALGAVQFLPLYEVVNGSFRSGEAAASLQQVRGWAYPWRRLITFGIPNFFGNPAHHNYFDLFTWKPTPALEFPDGQYIDWGVKNYVEGGAYLGLLPLFLAVIAVLADRQVGRSANRHISSRLVDWLRHPYIPFFTLLSLFSLGCIFGTPLYALVYVLPGLEQSHSPFRWVFPLTLAVAILAGFGVEVVQKSRGAEGQRSKGAGEQGGGSQFATSNLRSLSDFQSLISNFFLLNTSFSLVTLLAGLAFWGGAVTLVGLALSRVFFVQIEPLVVRAFLSLAKASEAFPDHRAFYSYEFKWVALFGLLLVGTGIVLRVSRCPIFIRRRSFGYAQGRPVWEFLAVGLLLLDFVTFGAGFNPAVDPALLDYIPPVVEFLKQDTSSLWRYAAFTPPDITKTKTKTMNANVGMIYGFQCIAGYDSLFTHQYAAYMALIEEQDELQNNRIASFSEWSSLDSPLTDLLNVKYVITEVEIPNPKYQLVYRDDAVMVYENLAVMPRAYTLPFLSAMETDDLASVVQDHDPRNYVILDAGMYPLDFYAPQPGTAVAQTVTRYTINEIEVDVQIDEASWLVLADSYFPGWKAFLRPQGAGEDAEEQVSIYRVNGTFRGVLLEEPGTWTVRFKYSPDSVKVGAFISFIAGMVVLFLIGIYLWRFFYREEDDVSTIRRVAKNSVAPIILNLFNQVILFAFVALMARILGPVGNGRYETAIVIFGWFEAIANFGLDMYLMREVARDRACAWKTFANTTVLRLLLFVAIIPVLSGFLAGRQVVGTPLDAETVWAVVLLYAGLLPGSVANGFAALFRGCEKHEYPAAIQTVTTIIQVTLGVLALVSGLGITGVAGASIITNVTTLAILMILARRSIWVDLPRARGELVWALQWTMLSESWPLMTSLLLQVLFPGVNALLLQYFHGDAAVGWYGAGRKWVVALNIIPAFFTMAVFPVVSRLAAEDRTGLQRSYRLSIKLLTMVALPVAVLVTLLATPLVGLLSGREFLPHGAVALQILVWSILFGWINSLTNYVLIALDRQRYVFLASGVRVVFAVVANLLFVGQFSYVASAWTLVSGELLLVLIFYADLRRQMEPVGWGRTLGRTVLAGLVMGAVAQAVAAYSLLLALLVSLVVYLAALVLLRVLTPEEREMLLPLLPQRRRRSAA
ncbi:MAG: oligosaccharide flippase family protein [Chloroflexota bacterium]|nr:oligosaccharide flippase family protein [Chloroflexota bacterium]